MKHLFIALALFVAGTFTQSANANTGKTNPAVQQTFQNTFSGATNVEWTITEDLYKASFTYNGQVVTAFYSSDGTQLALTKNISSDQLPITLQAELKKNYENYWVSDLFEMNDSNGVHYYITLETGDSKVVLKSQSSFSWGMFQKTKKA
jgi:hypothetical protein